MTARAGDLVASWGDEGRTSLFRRCSLRLCLRPLPSPRAPNAPPPPTTTGSTAAAASSAAPAACTEAERRELDFWLGDWDLVVRTRKSASSETWDEARGVSAIRSVLGGCAVEENFHADGPGAPWAGRSFSTYAAAEKTWRQTWVDDSGSYLAFTGGRDAGGFALYGEPRPAREAGGKPRRMRMVFREITRDSLDWSWEGGTEPATDWRSVMTIRYTRRPAAPPATACDADPSFHELDFWLGQWRVTTGGKEVGTNRITKSLGGCAIVEEWKDADGTEGRSLFFHPPASSTWKQIWITPAATSPGGSKRKAARRARRGRLPPLSGRAAAPFGAHLARSHHVDPAPGRAGSPAHRDLARHRRALGNDVRWHLRALASRAEPRSEPRPSPHAGSRFGTGGALASSRRATSAGS